MQRKHIVYDWKDKFSGTFSLNLRCHSTWSRSKVSKALNTSINTPSVIFPLVKDLVIFSTRSRITCSVHVFFWKPNWLRNISLFSDKYKSIMLYHKPSRILENIGNILLSLLLLLFIDIYTGYLKHFRRNTAINVWHVSYMHRISLKYTILSKIRDEK